MFFREEYRMYAAIRRYQIDPELCSEVVKRIIEDFVPYIRETQGLMGYYVLDAGDGRSVTLSICETEAAVETANAIAANWIKQFLASRILSKEKLSRIFLEVEETLQGPFHEGIPIVSSANSQTSQLLSVQEVCEALGMGKSWVYRKIRSGDIPSVKLGGAIKVNRADLDGYLKNHQRSKPQDEEASLL